LRYLWWKRQAISGDHKCPVQWYVRYADVLVQTHRKNKRRHIAKVNLTAVPPVGLSNRAVPSLGKTDIDADEKQIATHLRPFSVLLFLLLPRSLKTEPAK
jgi:hypothetical protein